MLNIDLHLKRFLSVYEDNLNEESFKEHRRWLVTLEEDELVYVLNPDNHPSFGGRRNRPKLPDLKAILESYRISRQPVREEYEVQREICPLCSDGVVFDAVEKDGCIEIKSIGRCTCRGGAAKASVLGLADKYPNVPVGMLLREVLLHRILSNISVTYGRQHVQVDQKT